jgi:hypothetical protein
VLKLIVDLHPVDWNGRHEDSCGSTGQGETPQAHSAEEAPWHARGKRSAWSGNQQAISITVKRKKVKREITLYLFSIFYLSKITYIVNFFLSSKKDFIL